MSKSYTVMELEAIKLLCKSVNTVASLPSTVIADTSVATNTTYSSYKIDAEMSALENDIQAYVDTALARLNKLTKEVIDDKALVVKENVLYLYKDPTSADNNYMQMMLINGVVVELGTTEVNLDEYVTKTELESELGTETLNTTSQTVKGAINELSQSVPTKTSQLTNDSNYQTAKQVNSAVTTEIAKVETELKGNIKELSSNLGDLTKLKTKEKSNVVGAVNEVANCVGVIITNPDDLDLNNYKTNGGYTFGNWKNYTNAPFNTTNGIMLVEDTGSYKTQIAIHRSTGVVKTRLFADGAWTPWVELATINKSADVGVTTITPSNSAITGTIEYTVKNGICYVSMKDLMSTVSSTSLLISSTMPKPSINCNAVLISSSGNVGLVYIDKNTTNLYGNFYTKNAKSYCSFSYPVAES